MADVKVEGLPEFLRALRRFEPAVRKEFDGRMRLVAAVVAATAKGLASWSRRIPGAIGVSVTGKGAAVRVSRNKAPHGPLYERGQRGSGTFRHPLFGNKNFWYSVPARPFLQPAVEAKRDEATEGMLKAVEATREALL